RRGGLHPCRLLGADAERPARRRQINPPVTDRRRTENVILPPQNLRICPQLLLRQNLCPLLSFRRRLNDREILRVGRVNLPIPVHQRSLPDRPHLQVPLLLPILQIQGVDLRRVVHDEDGSLAVGRRRRETRLDAVHV